MNEQKSLGERVLEYRAIHSMTQAQFAALAGLHRMTITYLENNPGWPIKATSRIRIERVLDGKTNE